MGSRSLLENIYAHPNQILVKGVFEAAKFAGKVVSAGVCKQNSGAGPSTIWRSQRVPGDCLICGWSVW